MKNLQDLLEELSNGDKKFYCREIAGWSENKKKQLEQLANILFNAGAKNPVSWAYSEINEGIPQLGRFLLLKNLYSIIKDPHGIIVDAAEFDDDIYNKVSLLTDVLGDELLNKMLQAYGKAIISSVISLLDEGNYGAKNDGVSWFLSETDANGKSTGRIIQGLHEDFYDFNE